MSDKNQIIPKGDSTFTIGITHRGTVALDFDDGHQIQMTAQQARYFAETLLEKANLVDPTRASGLQLEMCSQCRKPQMNCDCDVVKNQPPKKKRK